MTIPEQAVQAAQRELSVTIYEWERRREFLNVSPTLLQEFMRIKADDLTASILTAAAPHLAAVRVKKLDWVATGQTGFLETEFYAVAGSLMHTVHPLKDVDGPFNEHYSIHRDWNDREIWRVTYYVGNNGLSGISKACKSLDAAKDAAQADYAARILSALEPSAARELALEEVKLERSIERWRGMKPSEVMKGSTAQITYALEDARKDILSLARALSSPNHADDFAVDRFAIAMKQKLAKKREEGRGGWENKEGCSAEYLSYLLIQHIWKGDPVDIANLAMMLHQRGERIVIDSETSFIIPDHADAGKVEGDGWLPIESAPDHEQGPFLVTNNPKALNAFGRPSHVWCVGSIHKEDDGSFCAFDGYRKIHDLKMFAVVSAPSQEVA